MATKQRTSTKPTKRPTKRATAGAAKASGAAKAAASNGGAPPGGSGSLVRRVRMGRLDVEVHEPAEKDPKKRAEAVERAATRIKTTARLLPSDLRWER
jgi:hypothetical protein